MNSTPNDFVWSIIFSINSGPCIPSGNPGKSSTSVVIINCPPGELPAITNVFKFALIVYIEAVNPAGPEPIIITS